MIEPDVVQGQISENKTFIMNKFDSFQNLL